MEKLTSAAGIYGVPVVFGATDAAQIDRKRKMDKQTDEMFDLMSL